MTRSLTLLCVAAVPAFAMLEFYPAPSGVEASPHYTVRVSQAGRSGAAFVHFSPAQWKTNVSKNVSWASFAFEGRARISVTRHAGTDFNECRVLPSSRDIAVSRDGSTVSFEIDRPGQFSVEFDGSIEHPLLVFADPPERDVPARDDPNVLWYGPGLHELGEGFIEPRAGQTVYLAPGALVRGRIRASDAHDVRITGRGILSGQHLPANPPGTYTAPHLLELSGASERAVIEGITLVASPHYNIVARGDRSVVRNVKMMGWWYGTDGIATGTNGLVEDCFIKANDDALKLYRSGLVVRRCVIWQMENGAPFQFSWNMNTDNHGFHVSDIDIIRVEHRSDANNRAIFNSIHGGRGNMSGYLFEDIRIENADWRFMRMTVKKTSWSRSDTFGNITDVTIRNVTADRPFSQRSEIISHETTGRFARFTFENVQIAGQRIQSASDLDLDIDDATASDIRFVPEK
jgi:hypothetical protein